jgi:hypothetical protein
MAEPKPRFRWLFAVQIASLFVAPVWLMVLLHLGLDHPIAFWRIQKGMNYEEVIAILGGGLGGRTYPPHYCSPALRQLGLLQFPIDDPDKEISVPWYGNVFTVVVVFDAEGNVKRKEIGIAWHHMGTWGEYILDPFRYWRFKLKELVVGKP